MDELGNTATVSNADTCIWAYIDENTNIQHAQDGVRTATVTFNYYADAKADVNTATPTKTETYTFAQRYLYPVKVDRDGDGTKETTYYIEYFEEYLHNFDSDNDFNQTDYDGMAWGLDGLQISDTNQAIMVKGGWAGGLSDLISGLINSNVIPKWNIYYDFYLPRDDYNNSGITTHAYAGYAHCEKIINKANIGVLTLDAFPNSAVEYCYNKNKRNNDGSITDMHWYLPAIDEIEEIVMGAYTTFEVFQDKYYWASQPSYTKHGFNLSLAWGIVQRNGVFMRDDINRARGTKVSYTNGQYHNIESGVPSSYNSGVLYIRDTDVNSSSNYYSPTTGTYNDNQKYQEGNISRKTKNRIRAVYKP